MSSAWRVLLDVPEVIGGTLRAAPRLSGRELWRSLRVFGADSLALSLGVGALMGVLVIVQTLTFLERYGVRSLLGWAAGYALLREFGPLLLGLVLASRLGARNAAELATLQTGGQIEGLRGVALDPVAILVAPRVAAITLSLVLLAPPVFALGIMAQALTALWALGLPLRVFLDNFAHTITAFDLLAAMIKSTAFGGAIALVSTASGMSAAPGAHGVGEAAARAVVASCGLIFALDFILTLLLIRVSG